MPGETRGLPLRRPRQDHELDPDLWEPDLGSGQIGIFDEAHTDKSLALGDLAAQFAGGTDDVQDLPHHRLR